MSSSGPLLKVPSMPATLSKAAAAARASSANAAASAPQVFPQPPNLPNATISNSNLNSKGGGWTNSWAVPNPNTNSNSRLNSAASGAGSHQSGAGIGNSTGNTSNKFNSKPNKKGGKFNRSVSMVRAVPNLSQTMGAAAAVPLMSRTSSNSSVHDYVSKAHNPLEPPMFGFFASPAAMKPKAEPPQSTVTVPQGQPQPPQVQVISDSSSNTSLNYTFINKGSSKGPNSATSTPITSTVLPPPGPAAGTTVVNTTNNSSVNSTAVTSTESKSITSTTLSKTGSYPPADYRPKTTNMHFVASKDLSGGLTAGAVTSTSLSLGGGSTSQGPLAEVSLPKAGERGKKGKESKGTSFKEKSKEKSGPNGSTNKGEKPLKGEKAGKRKSSRETGTNTKKLNGKKGSRKDSTGPGSKGAQYTVPTTSLTAPSGAAGPQVVIVSNGSSYSTGYGPPTVTPSYVDVNGYYLQPNDYSTVTQQQYATVTHQTGQPPQYASVSSSASESETVYYEMPPGFKPSTRDLPVMDQLGYASTTNNSKSNSYSKQGPGKSKVEAWYTGGGAWEENAWQESGTDAESATTAEIQTAAKGKSRQDIHCHNIKGNVNTNNINKGNVSLTVNSKFNKGSKGYSTKDATSSMSETESVATVPWAESNQYNAWDQHYWSNHQSHNAWNDYVTSTNSTAKPTQHAVTHDVVYYEFSSSDAEYNNWNQGPHKGDSWAEPSAGKSSAGKGGDNHTNSNRTSKSVYHSNQNDITSSKQSALSNNSSNNLTAVAENAMSDNSPIKGKAPSTFNRNSADYYVKNHTNNRATVTSAASGPTVTTNTSTTTPGNNNLVNAGAVPTSFIGANQVRKLENAPVQPAPSSEAQKPSEVPVQKSKIDDPTTVTVTTDIKVDATEDLKDDDSDDGSEVSRPGPVQTTVNSTSNTNTGPVTHQNLNQNKKYPALPGLFSTSAANNLNSQKGKGKQYPPSQELSPLSQLLGGFSNSMNQNWHSTSFHHQKLSGQSLNRGHSSALNSAYHNYRGGPSLSLAPTRSYFQKQKNYEYDTGARNQTNLASLGEGDDDLDRILKGDSNTQVGTSNNSNKAGNTNLNNASISKRKRSAGSEPDRNVSSKAVKRTKLKDSQNNSQNSTTKLVNTVQNQNQNQTAAQPNQSQPQSQTAAQPNQTATESQKSNTEDDFKKTNCERAGPSYSRERKGVGKPRGGRSCFIRGAQEMQKDQEENNR